MSQHYILRRDGCDYQAPDLPTMRTWAQDGRVLPTDMVYSPKYQSWYRAKDLRELRDVLPRADGGRGASQAPQPVAAQPPAGGPQRQAQQFWLRKGEKNYAADSLATILRWASEGNIGPNDFIYHPAYNKWFRAGDSPQLASRFPNSVASGTPQPSAAQPAATPQATVPSPAQPAESTESADSVQRTVMDFKAAELHRMIQARRAEQAQAAQASRGNTRQGMAVAEIVAETHREQADQARPVTKTGPLTSGVRGDDASAVDTLRERGKRNQEAQERARPKLPKLPRSGVAQAGAARGPGGSVELTPKPAPELPARPRPAPELKATPAPTTPKPAAPTTPKPAAPRSATPKPAIPKPATPKPATPKPATPKPATPTARPSLDEGGPRPSPPALPKEVLAAKANDERVVKRSTGAPEAAPVADAGTGVDQGMAVPPDAAAAVVVRYADRLSLMKPFYDVARAFVVTKDMRPGEAQESKCELPFSGDQLQGQTKRSIYTLIARRMKDHLEGRVTDAKSELRPDELPGYALFLERAGALLEAFEAAAPIVGQKPPERFVIGNSGRAKISPDESEALLRIEACLKGLISIRAK